MYETLKLEPDGNGICLVTLNRPERMNSFTPLMADELEHFFRKVNGDDDIRAIIVTGAGKAFCAGMDLSVGEDPFGLDYAMAPTVADLRDRLADPAIERGVRDTGGRVALAIHQCLKPVIAAINGVAVGVGATMTLAMDFRLATQEARLGFVFGRIGITPEACSTWFLPRLVGMQQALEWVYTGEIIPAERALGAGLLRSLHTDERLVDDARALALRCIADRSPVSLALTRQMMRRNAGAEHPLTAHQTESLAVFHTAPRDGREGVRAFLEKRAPRFQMRVSRDMPADFPWWDAL